MLKPLIPKEFKKEFIGFDVETKNNNQEFVSCAFYGRENAFFRDREKARDYALSQKDKILIASNLPFDFTMLFDEKERLNFSMLWNGTRLLIAKTWVKHTGINQFSEIEFFNRKPTSGKVPTIELWDTINHAPFSVAKLGKILNIPKITPPDYLGKRSPETPQEWREMAAYNMRDAEISKKAMDFLAAGYSYFGGVPAFTLASTAMKTFRTSFLKDSYWTPSQDDALIHFKAYSGGRTEAIARGRIENAFLYDVNSLYPSVMRNNAYPHPNFMRVRKNDASFIYNFEGVSDIDIQIPTCRYPPLPVLGDKLYFPVGKVSGWFTHAEIRAAISRGATLLKCRLTHYSKEVCHPFDNYIDDIYALRLKWQKEGDARELVAKLLMNSLYGKFGQKFIGRDNMVPCSSLSFEQIQAMPFIERLGDYFRIKQNVRPAAFCMPIWAAYITSYARIALLGHLENTNALYCDTDSVVTFKKVATSSALGALKLECKIMDGVIVRPKFYAFETDAGERVKCKGFGAKMPLQVFYDVLKGKPASYQKFIKMRESLRRGLKLNSVVEIFKTFQLEDGKRKWAESFNADTLAWSEPWDYSTIQTHTGSKPTDEPAPTLRRIPPLSIDAP